MKITEKMVKSSCALTYIPSVLRALQMSSRHLILTGSHVLVADVES